MTQARCAGKEQQINMLKRIARDQTDTAWARCKAAISGAACAHRLRLRIESASPWYAYAVLGVLTDRTLSRSNCNYKNPADEGPA